MKTHTSYTDKLAATFDFANCLIIKKSLFEDGDSFDEEVTRRIDEIFADESIQHKSKEQKDISFLLSKPIHLAPDLIILHPETDPELFNKILTYYSEQGIHTPAITILLDQKNQKIYHQHQSGALKLAKKGCLFYDLSKKKKKSIENLKKRLVHLINLKIAVEAKLEADEFIDILTTIIEEKEKCYE